MGRVEGVGGRGAQQPPAKKCYFWHFHGLKFEPDNRRGIQTARFYMHVMLWDSGRHAVPIHLLFMTTSGLQDDVWKAQSSKNVIFLFFRL